MSQGNVEIVRRGFEAFQASLAEGDPGAVYDSGTLAPDAEWIPDPKAPLGLQPVYRGREGFVEFMRTWTENWDWSIDLERVIDAGDDRVVGIGQIHTRGKASGVATDGPFALVGDYRNGKTIRVRTYRDPAEALEAAGLSE